MNQRRTAHTAHRLANLMIRRPDKPPVFVAGNGRSGTSWIGETLGAAKGTLYYREPCHPDRNGLSMDEADRVWSAYVEAGGSDGYFESRLTRAFRAQYWPGSGGRFPAVQHRIGTRPRVVVKDVATFASVEWVYESWAPQVLIVLRHPGAYAASVDRLQQEGREVERFGHLRTNVELRDRIPVQALETVDAIRDPFDAAVASWAIRTRIVCEALSRHPEWHCVLYESVAENPVPEFKELFGKLALPWSADVDAWIRSRVSKDDAGMFSTSRVSSERIRAWRKELDPSLIKRVRAIIEPFEIPYFDDHSDWQ